MVIWVVGIGRPPRRTWTPVPRRRPVAEARVTRRRRPAARRPARRVRRRGGRAPRLLLHVVRWTEHSRSGRPARTPGRRPRAPVVVARVAGRGRTVVGETRAWRPSPSWRRGTPGSRVLVVLWGSWRVGGSSGGRGGTRVRVVRGRMTSSLRREAPPRWWPGGGILAHCPAVVLLPYAGHSYGGRGGDDGGRRALHPRGHPVRPHSPCSVRPL